MGLINRLRLLKQRLFSTSSEEWSGPYSNWELACANSVGYDSAIITEKTLNSAKKRNLGVYPYERDTVGYDHIQYNWPLLALLLSVIGSKTSLSVLDFGGSFGNTYSEVRNFIPSNIELKWVIVEQEHLVAIGQKEFQTKELSFEFDIDEAFKNNTFDLILCSGSLQYLNQPFEFLKLLEQKNFKYLLIDRTVFKNTKDHHAYVQHVPKDIYPASYACWIFDETQFLDSLKKSYALLHEFNAVNDCSSATKDGISIYYRGYLFKKNG